MLIDEIQHAEPILPEGTDLSRLRPEDLYNELIRRDYAVDVCVVGMFATVDGKRCRRRYEVDFVVNTDTPLPM